MKQTREELTEQLRAQNAQFEQVKRDLAALGDVRLAIPVAALEELESALSRCTIAVPPTHHFLRG